MTYRFFKLKYAICCPNYPADIGCVIFTLYPKFTEVKFYLTHITPGTYDIKILEFADSDSEISSIFIDTIQFDTDKSNFFIHRIPKLSIEQISGRKLVIKSESDSDSKSKFHGTIGLTSSTNVSDYEKKLKNKQIKI